MNIFKKLLGTHDSKSKSNQSESIKPSAAKDPSSPPAAGGSSFSSLGLNEAICRAVASEGYSSPTPIQSAAIPRILEGRDILGCAQTGTGKTAAFSLPMLQLLSTGAVPSRKIKALVVTPTRELALQVKESFDAYGRNLAVRSAVIFGGVGQAQQVQALQRGVDVLVATPGRLLDLKQQGFVDFSALRILVLDEADRMLDMGFLPDVKRIIAMLPASRQNLLLSATMPPAISQLALSLLHNPVKVEVAPVSSTAEKVSQTVYFVDKANKSKLLLHLLNEEGLKKVLVFTRTKATANRVVKFLESHEVAAAAIHGNKSQNARQKALSAFKASSGTSILVASDLAARGIDVESISHVINYDLPEVAETYVHRIGRTGRADASGDSLSFCSEEERAYLNDIQKLIRSVIPVASEHPYPPTFEPVAGGPRPPRPTQQRQQRSRPPGQAGSRGGRGAPGGRSSNQAGQSRAGGGTLGGDGAASSRPPRKRPRRRRRSGGSLQGQ